MGALDGLMDNLAKKYGNPPAFLRQELETYIAEELACGTSDEREAIYRAIGRSHRMVEGYPDVAAVEKALWSWTLAGFPDLHRKRVDARTFDPSTVPADPVGARQEHVRDYQEIAKARGIDTDKDGWLIRLVMQEIGRA